MEKYWQLHKVFSFLFRLASRMDIEGVEHVPEDGPAIIALNHISRLDTPALLLACPRRIYPLAADKYRKLLGFNWILNAGGAIWVKRYEFDREALLKALDVLRRGDVLGVAPEGTRSSTGSLQKGKPGVAFLAARTGSPIVPVGVAGTADMAKSFFRLRRMHIRVTFGESFYLPKSGKLNAEELAEATDMIMTRIAALLPESYRGVYTHALTG